MMTQQERDEVLREWADDPWLPILGDLDSRITQLVQGDYDLIAVDSRLGALMFIYELPDNVPEHIKREVNDAVEIAEVAARNLDHWLARQ